MFKNFLRHNFFAVLKKNMHYLKEMFEKLKKWQH